MKVVPKHPHLPLQCVFFFNLYEVHTNVYFVISKRSKLSPNTIPLPLCTVGLTTATPLVTAAALRNVGISTNRKIKKGEHLCHIWKAIL